MSLYILVKLLVCQILLKVELTESMEFRSFLPHLIRSRFLVQVHECVALSSHTTHQSR